jgi:1-acyl-sn-glycerol-3-phosphate acyltransferase
MITPTQIADQVARWLLPEEHHRLEGLRYDRGTHGFDPFGLHPSWVAASMAIHGAIYDHYFRVQSRGSENLPPEGRAILVANHGGELPIDGLMLWTDVVRHTDPPRVPRFLVDHFVSLLPFVSTIYARGGAVPGCRGNLHRLLERDELVTIFPEGTAGIGKPLAQRYRLQEWRVGHAEMAIRHRAPVIPAAIVGPDEQAPLVVRLPVHAFGAPWVPVSLLPLPLPVRYHIRYGAPILLHQRFEPRDADDPVAVAEAAEITREAVQSLLDHGVAERKGIFA